MKTRKVPLEVIVANISNECNLYCQHCFVDNEPTNLTSEEIKGLSIMAKTLKPSVVAIGGGEPFLNPHKIEQMLKEINRDIKVGVVTNGTLLTKHIIDWLNKMGCNYLMFSLEGMEEVNREIRGKYAFWKVVENIQYASQQMLIEINTTVNRINYNDLEEFIDFVSTLGISQHVLYRYLPIKNTDLSLTDKEWKDTLLRLEEKNLSKQYKTAYTPTFLNTDVFKKLVDLGDVNVCPVAPPSRILVDSTGFLYPCCLPLNWPEHIGHITESLDFNYEQKSREWLERLRDLFQIKKPSVRLCDYFLGFHHLNDTLPVCRYQQLDLDLFPPSKVM